MEDSSTSSSRGRRVPLLPALTVADLLAVLLISILALVLALVLSAWPFFQTWEDGSTDKRQRMRYHLEGEQARTDITILALDTSTQTKLGMFRSGQWLARKPYIDQLLFFEEYFRPSVFAYDLSFPDTLGEATGIVANISESADRLTEISRALERLAAKSSEVVSSTILADIARFSAEQGEIFFSQRFASIMENKCFPTINGFHFRGGWVDPQPGQVSGWTDADVFGQNSDGNEEGGMRVPYLLDVRIPSAAVHFPSPADASKYKYALNASLPMSTLLDYTHLGYFNVPRDSDSVVRRVPLVMGFLYSNSVTKATHRVFVPSLAMLSAMMHLGISTPIAATGAAPVEVFFGREIVLRPPGKPVYHIPIDDRGNLYLNFDADYVDFSIVSFGDVAPSYRDTRESERDAIAQRFRNQIDRHVVLVGAVATGLGDIGACPLSSQTPLVFVHAMAVSNILDQTFLIPLRHPWILALVLFLVFTALCLHEQLSTAIPRVLLLLLLYLILTYASIHFHWQVFPVIWPVLYMMFGSFGVMLYRYFAAERARLKIRGMFSTMVSADVLRYLEKNPESFSLAGQSVDATMFLSDIAKFTPMSEKLPPADLTRLINTYLTPVTDCIMKHGGYVDKYLGDGVMAVWGAPFPNQQHAADACRAALEQQIIIRQLNPILEREFGFPIRVRMGLNSGHVTAGNMGSNKRLQYTVMGDAVNLAARLEPVNDDYGTGIVIGETTWELARAEVVGRWLDTVVVVGRSEPVRIYELVGLSGKVPDEVLQLITDYEQALTLYTQRQWVAALAQLEKILVRTNDQASRVLQARIQKFQETPPPAQWKGEHVRRTK